MTGPEKYAETRSVDEALGTAMNYEGFFGEQLSALRREGRYRVFADLERSAGRFPSARCHESEGAREITVWCSNDYLGMGQHPKVVEAMHAAIARCGGHGLRSNLAKGASTEENPRPWFAAVLTVDDWYESHLT